jgi:hypothetical protein
MVWHIHLRGRSCNNGLISAWLTVDRVAGVTKTSPWGGIGRGWRFCSELSVVRFLRSRQV